ncbi:hypothetical protein [Scytonema sp. NUACC26]|uniref:hypothetical protein n=1 Tax=Scytonema sp. NUACC26 TaxID=3140176 RepID=UPI0038B3E1D4
MKEIRCCQVVECEGPAPNWLQPALRFVRSSLRVANRFRSCGSRWLRCSHRHGGSRLRQFGGRFALIGETSDGTHEFYQQRAEITKHKQICKGFEWCGLILDSERNQQTILSGLSICNCRLQ